MAATETDTYVRSGDIHTRAQLLARSIMEGELDDHLELLRVALRSREEGVAPTSPLVAQRAVA